MLAFIVCLFCIVSSVVHGAWVPAKFTVTTDNGYAIYVGSSAGVTYLGSEWATQASHIFQPEYYPVGPLGKNDPTPPATPLYLDDTQSVYVVAWADGSIYQGVLFNFEINGVQISPNNPAWEVYPSAFYPQPTPQGPTPACNPAMPPPYDRPGFQFGQDRKAPPCPTWVAQSVASADANSLWEPVTLGGLNVPGPNQNVYNAQVGGIPQTARWMWYQSDQCAPSADAPFDNPFEPCHHKEPLIFRLPSTAWQVDPDACHKAHIDGTSASFCTGQCPTRPDGTFAQCVSTHSPRGDLRSCECCGIGCAVVVMPELSDNYCAGTCPDCQQCSAKEYGTYYPEPNGPPKKYIRSCSCETPAMSGRCEVDRCNNVCVGRCPLDTQECVPKRINNETLQIEECGCPGVVSQRCHLELSGPTREPVCVGRCRNDETKCKAAYTDGLITSCSCDCCDLERDAQNPLNNRCQGKCDISGHACQVSRQIDWVDPQGVTHSVTAGCACDKPRN